MLDGPSDHGHDCVRYVVGGDINDAAIGTVVMDYIHPIGRKQSDAQYACDTHSLDTTKAGLTNVYCGLGRELESATASAGALNAFAVLKLRWDVEPFARVEAVAAGSAGVAAGGSGVPS
jgi:hypothetical protein